MKSKIIAISSMGAGLTAICLTLGAYIEAMDFERMNTDTEELINKIIS